MPTKKYRYVKKRLIENGWEHVRTNGSHAIIKNVKTGVTCPVKCTKDDIPAGTDSSIEKLTGIKL